MEWQVASFDGDGEDFNRLASYLLEEGVDQPTFIDLELDKTVSLASSDPIGHVDVDRAEELGYDTFSRRFPGSAIVLEPEDFHFIFAFPSPEYESNTVEDYAFPVIGQALEQSGVVIEKTGRDGDYSLRHSGYPIADMNKSGPGESTIFPGFVSFKPWNSDEIASMLELRSESEKSYIDYMPSVNDISDTNKDEFLERIYDNLSIEKGPYKFIVPGDYEQKEMYSREASRKPYNGFCPVLHEDLILHEIMYGVGDSFRSLTGD